MLRLVIGNKNYSSWSLRPWLLLQGLGIPFEEITLKLDTPEFAREIKRYSPAGRVPVLLDGELAVWDSLAITEYLAEKFPDLSVWPSDPAARARARSVCAEMHSGFASLRSALPMNVRASLPGCGWSMAVQADVDRITGIWTDLLERSGGPFLFGKFGAADAFYAPVASRSATYALKLAPEALAYRDRILAMPAMQQWCAAGRAEAEFLIHDEPYSRAP